jgi:hypothetical protein
MFPSILNTFNRPTTSDRLDSPSHSALHNSVSSALGQVEAFIGRSGNNSTLGTLLYDIRSPDSGGGGHIQVANKGGTGQTTYAKGDILVASSSSVLGKLAASPTINEVLITDPTQAVGVKWATNPNANKVTVKSSVVNLDRWQASAVSALFSTSVLGSTLGTSGAIRFTGAIQKLNTDNNDSLELIVRYGNNSVATANISSGSSVIGTRGIIEGMIINNNSVSSQIGYIKYFALQDAYGTGNITTQNIYGYGYGTSSINSSADQSLVITGQFGGTAIKNSILTGLFVVEKIS